MLRRFALPEDKVPCPPGRGGGLAAASGGLDIGLRKVGALEHQRLAQMAGAGIGKTVPEIEPRRMAALAEAVEGVQRHPRRLGRHCNHGDLHQREIALDRLRRLGDWEVKLSRHRDRSLPDRERRGQPCSGLLQARQQLTRLVLVGQERSQRRGVDEHQASSYRLSRNALSAGRPFAGWPLARRSRQNWTPRSTKDGLPCSRSSSWTSAVCTASVSPIFFTAATLRASASVSGFLMWKAMARSSRSYRVSVYIIKDTPREGSPPPAEGNTGSWAVADPGLSRPSVGPGNRARRPAFNTRERDFWVNF